MIPYIDIPISYLFRIPEPAAFVQYIPKSPEVPFFSQLRDIEKPEWRKKSCGIAGLAMIIEYYKPGTVKLNTLLKEGIDEGAYVLNAGWSHRGLALLSEEYGLHGKSYDLSGFDKQTAFIRLKEFLEDGPVMASVHYKFEPKNPIPHLVVINGFEGDDIYYNDPATDIGGKKISASVFLGAWKKRFIVFRPDEESNIISLMKQ